MKTGLVFGKFLPLHKGHLALIKFALQHCDKLNVLVCASDKETISGTIRKNWLLESFDEADAINIFLFEYKEDELPNTSDSSIEVSLLWSEKFMNLFPEVDIVFTSEPYGDYVSGFMNIEHKLFDKERSQVSISGSEILKNPFTHWEYISDAAKPHFVKKIAILGSESTGKSTLTEKLGNYFNTSFVPETAREIIEKTNDVVFEDLLKIATLQATTVIEKKAVANRLLICDTDLSITKSYARYLFKKELIVPSWIEEVNKYDMYLFLETDCPFVQDGTRLKEKEREDLNKSHKKILDDLGITYNIISGTWEQRFEEARRIIKSKFIY